MTTIVETFWSRVDGAPERPALRQRIATGWETTSWGTYGRIVEEAAAGLVALGLEPGDRVGILASNHAHWHEADMAVLTSGGASVPAYPTSASGQVSYLLDNSGARMCFVADSSQLAKVLLRRHRLQALEHVIIFGDAPDGLDDDFLLTFDDLCSLGRDRLAAEPQLVRDRSSAIDPAATATIVYTSGTTGPPKGTVLTFANLSATIRSITTMVPIDSSDRFLSFLPLSHIAERVVSHFGQIVSGGETWFAESITSVAEDLRACRPTVFFAVPRVWEKFKEAILEEVESAPAAVQKVASAYFDLAQLRVLAARDHRPLDVPRRIAYRVMDRVFGTRLRSQLGLDEARILVSGAAPIHPDLLWWFWGIGLPIAEVYGQTEDCGPTSLNPTDAIHIGSVGRPLPGVEVRIADDGEILVKGPNVTPGYFGDPAHTAALIDEDGWMHSGDLGRLDVDGYLHVTGRKKDLIITSSGKNIAPQELEIRLRTEPLVGQAVIVGDGRSYLTALIALDADALAHWAREQDKHGSFESLIDDPEVHEVIAQGIERVNQERSRIEQIKAWRLIPRELSIRSGELTPTLKVKRDVVAARFGDLIEEMYAAAA
jgi:long-chain acyl-CoA synthetase